MGWGKVLFIGGLALGAGVGLAALASGGAAATALPSAPPWISWPAQYRRRPKDPKRPSSALERAIYAAAGGDLVLARLLFALSRREAGFELRNRGQAHGDPTQPGAHQRYVNGYLRDKDKLIPGSSITWGQKFRPIDWGPYGALQLNPYYIWGIVVPASAPLTAAYDPDVIAQAAARVLRLWRSKTTSYERALYKYWNTEKGWLEDVVANYLDLGGARAEIADPPAAVA